MQEFTKIELEVKNPQGVTKRFTCDMTMDYVWKGGNRITVACPQLLSVEACEELDDFTDYSEAFEVIYYNFLEGCFTTGEITSRDDRVLATWKFLVDGNPANIDELIKHTLVS
jgi:hypothetical protein